VADDVFLSPESMREQYWPHSNAAKLALPNMSRTSGSGEEELCVPHSFGEERTDCHSVDSGTGKVQTVNENNRPRSGVSFGEFPSTRTVGSKVRLRSQEDRFFRAPILAVQTSWYVEDSHGSAVFEPQCEALCAS
jgi:hypothetical protein